MRMYIARRIAFSIPTILGVMVLVFFSVRLMPGDIVDILETRESAMSLEQAASLRRSLGIDTPIHQQFVEWTGAILRGDFGQSFYSERSVMSLIRQRLPITFQLGIMAVTIGALIGLPLGIISALKVNTKIDFLARTVAVIGLSAPNFWLAIMAILFLSKLAGWSPPVIFYNFTENPRANLEMMVLPALILATGLIGALTRYLRSSLLEVMRQDYIVTARAKGLGENRVVWRHAMKNAAIPVLTVFGLHVAGIVGGSVVMEQIFAIPGMGRLMLDGIFQRDYAIVQGAVLVIAASYVYINLLVDLTYGLIDPRIRYN